MAKSLKDILAGVKSSKIVPGSTGKDPGVDYMPKAPAEQDFVAKHKTEKHADRVGNGPDVYNGEKVKYSLKTPQNKRTGRDLDASKAAYKEEVEIEEGARLVKVHTHGNKSAKVYKDNEYGEYRVKHYTDGKHHSKADYHTDNKDDAHGTAHHWLHSHKEEVEIEEGKECEECGKSSCGCGDKKKGLRKLLLGDKKEPIKEAVDDIEDEHDMVRRELNAIIDKASMMLKHLDSSEHIEPWVQAKVANAKGMISGCHDYMMYGEEVEIFETKNKYRTAMGYDKDDKPTGGIQVRSNRQALKLLKKFHPDKEERVTVRLFKGDPTGEGKISHSKLAKEEVEELDEIGNTAKGRTALKKYIEKNVAGKEALDKEYALSHEKREKHGAAFFKAVKQHEKGARTKDEVEQLRGPHEKAQKKEQHLFKKVRSRDAGQIAAQKRIDTKGKNFIGDEPTSSKRKVDTTGKGVREETVNEVITSKTSISDIIHDFIHSDNPKFAGKSKEERKRMALGAYYAKHPEKSIKEAQAVEPLIGESGKKKKAKKESGPDGAIRPSGDVPNTTQNVKSDTGYSI